MLKQDKGRLFGVRQMFLHQLKNQAEAKKEFNFILWLLLSPKTLYIFFLKLTLLNWRVKH